jgi:hypothetical protein
MFKTDARKARKQATPYKLQRTAPQEHTASRSSKPDLVCMRITQAPQFNKTVRQQLDHSSSACDTVQAGVCQGFICRVCAFVAMPCTGLAIFRNSCEVEESLQRLSLLPDPEEVEADTAKQSTRPSVMLLHLLL